MSQCTSSSILLNIFFLRVSGDIIISPLHIMPFCMVSLCRVSLKSLSTIEQLIHLFLFILSRILLHTGSSFVSILSRFRVKTSISTQCRILSCAFSCFSIFSLLNSSLDRTSTLLIVFPFTYIRSKSNATSLIAYLKILKDVILSNSLLRLNMNFNGLWFNSSKGFRP